MTMIPDRLTTALADRYRIERELGQGGMATVYLAQDLKHDRKVAVKVLRPELAAVIGAERFLQEVRTTASLQHPNILALFDSGSADGYLYYVMPFVEGETLRDRLDREKQLSVADSIAITSQIAAALAYAHERGIVHRDIKPDNIMFSSGQAVVADFGIARAIGSAGGTQLTATGMAIGTPAYMSPEQSAGESDVDGRSDLYSLASVLYEMLAGEAPFTGQTAAAIIAKRLGAPTPQVRVVRPAVPEPVDRVLQKALQRAPADRYATVAEFAHALRSDSLPRPKARLAALALVGILALVSAGWWVLRGRGITGNLDDNVIAVMPFRVGGAGIGYLRESMLDLLDARLTGTNGPRTVEPRALLSAWRRAGGTDVDDLSDERSRQVAARLGAGRVLLGSAIATPTEFTLRGSLRRVSDGKVVADGVVEGSADSVAVLVNRLAARLLSLDAGEERERLDGLAATSLDALQDYLAGRKAYRRGEYFTAMDLYDRAFARDSTFAQAAFGLLTTNPHIGTVLRAEGFMLTPTVWRLRDRLSARDVALLRSWVGPNYPAPSSYAEVIAQAEIAASDAPDSPEHWFALGNALAYYGAVSSQQDWPRRAADALDHAIALDSSFTPAVAGRLFVAMCMQDDAAIRRLAALMEGPVTAGFADGTMLWAAALTLGDSAGARRWREQGNESHINYVTKLVKIPLHAVTVGLPLGDARWSNQTLRRDGATEQERGAAQLGEFAVAAAEGRLVSFGKWNFDEAGLANPWVAANLVRQALVEPGYEPQVRELIRQYDPARWPPVRDCFVELYRVSTGDTSSTRQAIQRLRAFAASNPPPIDAASWRPLEFRVCPLLLETLLEAPPLGSRGGKHLDELEALMRTGPRWFTGAAVGPTSPVSYANWTIARLREREGDIPAALAAIRRREMSYYPEYLWILPAFLRQEGRLAALVGDTAGARRAYDQYLTLRTDPDPVFQPQRDSVIAERAALRSP
ncbi:MAG TPA: serine/threonine-protein kinase [Gemmatimonadales bacterium]|nr:serine/threonine-protein kinase [Gemmatimonadales bacterium]